ncbi:MAG: PQQ-binding-like beta-propeller repeat protein [Sphingomonadales bacterium]|nr:PQQ-binding-like beta-propeller repeat protein [Sphingomonadales bacterium]
MRLWHGLALLALGAASPVPGADGDWTDYDGPGATHSSLLDQIDAGNVARLGLAWHHDIDVGGQSLTAPVEADGVLYLAAGASTVLALDAATGRLLWQVDTHARQKAGVALRGAWGSRGIAYAHGQVFTGTMDGRLIALDARTGKPRWSRQTTVPGDERYISGAPWIAGNLVVVGHGGADYAPVRGYVTAYDQKTGQQAWRFWTVPGNPAKGFENPAMALAAKTWTGPWWKFGGGATVWNAMAYDPKYGTLYIGTGNGSPWNRKIRSPEGGDNLFVCSIIALDAKTGRYKWHYQVNPGESWDYNADMDIELADGMVIDGQKHDVLMQAPKNGFFYVIDRRTGKLLSAKAIVPMNWASGIDMATGRPIENPAARFPDGKPTIVYPSPFGAHNIEAMSFNAKTGLAYIPAMDQGRVYLDPPGPLRAWRFRDGQRISNGIGEIPADPKPRPPHSFLLAWDVANQREAWRLPLQGPRGGGGTMTTAGNLLFQGRGEGQFTALAADSGRLLWQFDAQTAVMAQPITYSVRGRQFVAVVAGSRYPTAQGFAKGEWDYRAQQWRVLVFALDGKDGIPAYVAPDRALPDDAGFTVDPALAKAGAAEYADRCATCHGAGALSGGAAPDLLRSAVPLDPAGFAGFVRHSPLVERGMPAFAEVSETALVGVAHYLRQRARAVAAGQARPVVDKGQ